MFKFASVLLMLAAFLISGCKKEEPIPLQPVVVAPVPSHVEPKIDYPVIVHENDWNKPVEVGTGLQKFVVILDEDVAVNQKWIIKAKVDGLWLADESKKALPSPSTVQSRLFRFDVKPGLYAITFVLTGDGGYTNSLRSVTYVVYAK